MVADVPVVADLRSAGSLGVCGPGQLAHGVARGLVVQLAGLHSPADVALTAIVSTASRPSWEWLRWLPHVGSVYSPLVGDHLADDSAGGSVLLAALDGLVRERRATETEAEPRLATTGISDGRPTLVKSIPRLPAVVVIVEDDAPVDRSRITRLAEMGADVGVYVIWVASSLANLPAVCRSFVLVETESTGSTAGEVRLGQHTYPIACEAVAVPVADQVARLLSPIVDVGVSVADETDLPTSLPFLSLTGDGVAVRSDSVLARWQATDSIIDRAAGRTVRRRVDGTLRAPVGSTGPDTFWLDLREHGPHALVGGTTGAGKSEFLQTWILGMATEHSPDRVNFLFVDYKGGTAFADCVRLPHSVGLVTDLSPHLVTRALTSLRAEVRRREELLNAKHAKDLVSLERSGDLDTPPSLVIIVDEFAALAKEVPEFVDGVIDIAQRGRSLGLHLILATQRPAGVIKESLRANTNLRIALRMADADDSTDILGSPDAAFFPPQVPGRAAAKIGNARTQAFQSGYTGGWTVGREVVTSVEVADLAFGTGTVWESSEATAAPDTELGDPDIVHVVSTVCRAAADAVIATPRRPWLPELQTHYDLAELVTGEDRPAAGGHVSYVLGVADDPERQSQPATHFSPDIDGNLVVLGTGGAGKSALLRSIAAVASMSEPDTAVEIFGIDCGTGGLRMLEALPTVGSIVAGDDDERVGRLLRRLVAEIGDRSDSFGPAASTLPQYRVAADAPGTSRIILLLDGLAAFREMYETSALSPYLEMVTRIAGDGRAVGVHVLVSADRHTAVPSSLGALIQKRLVLRLADDTDYLLAGVPTDALFGSPPGRGHLDGRVVHVGTLGGSPDTAVQAAAMSALGDRLRESGVEQAAPVAALPEQISLADMPDRVRTLPVIGLRDVDLGPCTVVPRGTLMVTGPPGSGRSGALATLVTAVKRAQPDIRTLLLTPRRSTLADLPTWDALAVGTDDVQTRIADVSGFVETAEPGSLMVVIESVTSFTGMIESELLGLVKACTQADQMVVAEAEISTWSGAFTIAQAFKAARRGILLHPGDLDTETYFQTPTERRRRSPLIPGRGYFIERGTAVRVQLAQTH
ncbi:FtsK/SpoIIIE domain-containing protein [Williamsia maris]